MNEIMINFDVSPKRLPAWPTPAEWAAGVVDQVDGVGFGGWIIDLNAPNDPIEFMLVCKGKTLAVGQTSLVRPDVTSRLLRGNAPGFLVPWSAIDLQALWTLFDNNDDAVVEFFVPAMNTILTKFQVGELTISEIVGKLPRGIARARSARKTAVRAGPVEASTFYTVGLPPAGLQVTSKRICFVTTEFHGLFKNGGIGTANTGLALELAEAGWDVSVLFIDCDDEGPRTRSEPFADVAARYKKLGVTLEYLPRYPEIFEQFRDIRRVSYAIYKYVWDKAYGAIYFNECGGQGFFTIMAAKAGALPGQPKIVVVTHGPNDWTHELNSQQWSHPQLVVLSFMEKKCIEYADFVVSPSEYLLHWMREREWKLPASLYVEQNIVSVADQQATPVGKAVTAQPIHEIVFFGRQEVRKGVVLFCDAIDRIVETNGLPSGLMITFLGKIWKIGATNSAAYILLRSAKWGVKVRFLSSLGQLEANAYLRGAGRLAVIPSLAENSPCVVAECLQLGIPFIATNAGGTAELVAPEDRTRSLVQPQAAALADRISACLSDGQRPSSMAVEQRLTRIRWRDFMKLRETPPPQEGKYPKPLVSVCLVHYERPHFLRQAFESILAQTYQNLELIIVDDGSRQPETLAYLKEIEQGSWRIKVKVVRQKNKYLGAARNNAVRAATGDYFLFVDDDNLLMPDAVADFVRAADHYEADVVTGVPLSFYHRQKPDQEFDGEIRMLPLGGCAEVGFFENCYGDANALVSRRAFETVGGFHEVHGEAVEDWEFFAKCTLNGLKVEVVPKPTFWYRVLESGMFVKSDPVANARRIARAYHDFPIRHVGRMLELSWEIDREQRFRMLQLAEQEGGTGDTLIRLSDTDPETTEAKRLLLQFMVEHRRVQEALDFALHNDMALVEHVTVAARAQMAQEASEELNRYDAIVKTKVSLTDAVRGRAEPLYGIEGGVIDAGGHIAFTAAFDAAIVRAEEVCPSGAQVVTARCVASGAFDGYEVCLVVCASGVNIDLEGADLSAYPGVRSSGWITVQPDAVYRLRVTLQGEGTEEPHDIFLIARAQAHASGICALAWSDFEAEIVRIGAARPSVIRPRFSPRRLSERVIAEKGRPITRNGLAPSDLDWFVPGYPATLHPIHGAVAAIRLGRVVPPGALGARVTVSVTNENAYPIQFGLWLHPNAQPLKDERHLDKARHFSGWLNVTEKNIHKPLQFVADTPLEEAHDIYIASRVVGQPNVWFCHALVHDVFVLVGTD